jgi:carboxyl-terminal processing protease
MFKSTTKREGFWILLSLFLSVSLLFGGNNLTEVNARESNAETRLFEELKIFTDVLSLVQRDYVKEVKGKELVEGAIKGLLSSLDPHSGYLNPDFYQDLQVQTKGEFGGLGIEITMKDGLLVVVTPMQGSPAETAGIRAGDRIVKIEGQATKDFSLIEAVKNLRGPKGSEVTLSIHRDGFPDVFDVIVPRDIIKVDSVKARYLGDGLGYVRINQFLENTSADLKKALSILSDQTPDKKLAGLVIDLRNNPGGLLTQAVKVTDMFLKEGVIVYTDSRVENQKQRYYARNRATEPEYPMVVLVNEGSASASEIFAGAMKDHGRAIVVGTQTFGKGSVQTISPLSNGGAVTLTTALYYTKSGNSIQATGVTPDIEVSDRELEEEALVNPEESSGLPSRRQRRREADLPNTIENPNGITIEAPSLKEVSQEASSSSSSELLELRRSRIIDPQTIDLDEWTQRDRPFSKALELLKTFDVFENVVAKATK